MENVTGFKLVNGSEMVAELISETDSHYEIENAMFWDLIQTKDGKIDVEFSPISLGMVAPADATHFGVKVPKFPKNAVLFDYTLRPEIANRYKQIVSPIAIVQNTGVIARV